MTTYQITSQKAYAKMASICAKKECSSGEIAKKLSRYDITDGTVDGVIAKLIQHKFIDDRRFAECYIKDKVQFNKWGRRKIELGLRQKGVSSAIIKEAFDEMEGISSSPILAEQLQKKWPKITGKSLYERRNKLIRFALGRGFDMDDIMRCLDTMNLNYDEE